MNSDPVDLLQFNEFPTTHGNSSNNSQAAQININSPVHSSSNANANSDPLQDLVNDMTKSVRFFNEQDSAQQSSKNDFNNDQNSSEKQVYSFWSIEYYQQFFNVDTLMVIDRIASSMIPKRAPPNYLKSHIGLNPDLYGPFWISITLVS